MILKLVVKFWLDPILYNYYIKLLPFNYAMYFSLCLMQSIVLSPILTLSRKQENQMNICSGADTSKSSILIYHSYTNSSTVPFKLLCSLQKLYMFLVSFLYISSSYVQAVLDTFKFNTKNVKIGSKEIILPSACIICREERTTQKEKGNQLEQSIMNIVHANAIKKPTNFYFEFLKIIKILARENKNKIVLP